MTNGDSPAAARRPTRASMRGLAAILIGITLGSLLGVFYGRPMWIAAGGPQEAVAQLEAALEQARQRAQELEEQADEAVRRGERARAAELRAEAARLDDQRPAIAERLSAARALLDEHRRMLGEGPHEADPAYVRAQRRAALAWELTRFCGELFLQVLKLLVIPLVVTSMICGVTSLGDIRRLGHMGFASLAYYLSTGGVAVLLGIFLVLAIRPGQADDDAFSYVPERVAEKEELGALEMLLNVVRGEPGDAGSGMFPANIFEAASQTNVLALIVFSIIFGGALSTIGPQARVVIEFFRAANAAVLKMVHLVIWFAPLGIFGLVATGIARNGGGRAFLEQLQQIGWYVATVSVGLLLHGLLLALLLAVVARRNPLTFTVNMLQALLTALSTASSSATLPVTMECVEQKNGVSKRSSGFVLPLGATVNMDGTALYEAVAVIFIAQSLGVELTLAQLVVIFLTATLAAIGAAGIPEAGLVTMVLVLTAVGLPIAGIGKILAIDWFLDRLRTTINVYGDAVGAAVLDRLVAGE